MSRFKQELERLKETGGLRKLSSSLKKNIIDLSTNDYLGIARNNKCVEEFYQLAQEQKIGFGAVSSRLLTGNHSYYLQLEKTIRESYQKEACLVFSSGYHANAGIISALSGKKDLVLADKLVHASIIDGMKLSQAEIRRFNHLDYGHLVRILEKKRDLYENVWIISESIFSMDGDEADLKQLVEIKKAFNSYLYIDEAHALGVRGKQGLGCAEQYDCIKEIDFIVGTFGKALASAGAFLVCNQLFEKYLVNCSRTLIYTTALPPLNVAWTDFIFEKMLGMNDKRESLMQLAGYINEALKTNVKSHIVPFITGSNEQAVYLAEYLYHKGYNVLPIRNPSVRKGTERVRLSLRADFTIQDLKPLVDELIKYRDENILAK